MRFSPALLVPALLACSACSDGCVHVDPCRQLPAVTDACGAFVPTGETQAVCGCPVTLPEGEPFCTVPDGRAPISMSWWDEDDPETYHIGTWPDLGSLPATTCPTSEDLVELGLGSSSSGSLPVSVDGNRDRDWVELTFSPSGDMAAIYERRSPGYVQAGTLLRCAEGDDPGWMVETFLETVTSPFIRWGVAQGDTRQIYLMLDDFYRLSLRVEPVQARPAAGGGEQAVMVIEQAELLARSEAGALAFGDLDVGFDLDEGGAPVDRYAVYMSGMDASYFPLYVEAAIYVTDLADCAAECTEDMAFCCRTAFLTQGDSDHPDTPTNPGISEDGALLAFNRFTSTKEQCPDWALCAQEHVLRNPLHDPAVFAAHCVQDDEHDGFHAAIDCADLLETGGRFDDDKCPDHACCGEGGVDCSSCITIGAQPEVDNACAGEGEGVRERNYVFFFELDGATWVGFRSADLLQDSSEELHLYRLDLEADGGFASIEQDGVIKLLLGRGEGLDKGDFGPGPWRRLPGDAICD
jgi:hypothetical protein